MMAASHDTLEQQISLFLHSSYQKQCICASRISLLRADEQIHVFQLNFIQNISSLYVYII